jgi:hypothetical protein
MGQAIGGRIILSIDGIRYRAKGEFTYNLGGYTRETVMGHTGPEGFKKMAREPFVEGEITDTGDFNVIENLYDIEDATIILELANGKVITFKNAWYSGTGDIRTEEGNINFRFTASSAKEVTT